MYRFTWKAIGIFALVVAAAACASAETSTNTGRSSEQKLSSRMSEPMNERAMTTETYYDSAFARYKPYHEQQVRPWQEVNDEVGHIGGWKAYAREATQDEAANGSADDKTK